ncbi:putative membrane protein [Acinetobacter baumannii 25307_4]|nr:putative membrane protein [Acinetobacter baumannii 25307_4]
MRVILMSNKMLSSLMLSGLTTMMLMRALFIAACLTPHICLF